MWQAGHEQWDEGGSKQGDKWKAVDFFPVGKSIAYQHTATGI